MSAFSIGKKIFENRSEYPLPKKEGTKDYLFFFVPTDDKYGKAARYFFDRFYKNHRRKNVNSLEVLIAHLHTEGRAGSISHIREIILVAHGNAQGLIFPVVNGVSDANLQEYKYLTAGSLAFLQKDFLDGKFPEFNTKRKEVITLLTEDSWITIRACNFGQSRAGLYALYSFFGGRANVYSPKVFQFFGTHPIMPDMRLETKLEVHEHLVKQRFLPKDIHTPDRKDAIVRFLADPARFSEPIDLLTADLEDDTSPATLEYEQIINDLNGRRVAGALETRLGDNGIALSSGKRVIVRVKNVYWIIRDILKHLDEDHTIEYHLSENVALPQVTLQVEATIPDVHSAREFFPIQLFFNKHDNDIWRGQLFVLAGHAEAPDADPAAQEKFEAVLSLLNSLQFGDNGGSSVNLVELFQQEGIELTPARTLSLVSEAGSGSTVRKTWLLKDGSVEYYIKLEHPASSTGIPAHTLIVYEHPGERNALKREYELMSWLGADPDQPGTELLAYLDNLPFDELTNLIDHLRNPYLAENVPYVHHAIQAIERKKDFLSWFSNRPEFIENAANPKPLFGLFFPYTNLTYAEREDKSFVVYDFNTDLHWAEVKASNPPTEPFVDDLFVEQTLPFGPDELAAPDHLEPDSLATDIEELRALEAQGIEQFFSAEKFTFDEAEEDPKYVSCQKFKELIEQLKGLEGQSQAEIEEALNDITIIGDISLFNVYGLPKPISYALNFWTVTSTEPGVAEKVLSALIKRQPALSLGTIRLTPISVHISRALPYIGIATLVGEMFWNFLKEQSNTLEKWEQAGKLTAIRQWARRLESLTFQRQDDFPEKVEIDLVAYAAELRLENPLVPYLQGPYFEALYHEEEYQTDGVVSTFIFGPDHMKKGFDEGAQLIEKEANEMLSKSERIIDEVLKQGGLDACKIRVLRDAGIIDPAKFRALVMREFARLILQKTPKV